MNHIKRTGDTRQAMLAAAMLVVVFLLAHPNRALAQWVTAGNNIYNGNSGNVGIGTATPTSRFHVFETPVNVSTPLAGSYFYLEPWNNTGSTINTTHSVISVEGSTQYGSGWAGLNGVKSVVGPYWGPITDARSFYAQGKTRLNYHGIGNYYGFFVDTPVVVDLSSITNSFGFYVSPQKTTNVGNGYGIYQVGASDINYFSGNVGIGTATPGEKLHVVGGVNVSGPIAGFNAFPRDGSGAVHVWYNPTGDSSVFWSSSNGDLVTIQNAGNVGIGTTAPTTKLHVVGDLTLTGTGNISAAGNIAAKYQDVAEWVPASHAMPAGTVVVVDAERSNHVLASSKAYDTRVAGVVSEKPGVILGEAGEGKVMVATTGRVRVKVDATNAPIRVGDLLVTSDKEGIAMRSQPVDINGTPFHRPGTLIGKALEPLEKGVGEVLVLLSLQ